MPKNDYFFMDTEGILRDRIVVVSASSEPDAWRALIKMYHLDHDPDVSYEGLLHDLKQSIQLVSPPHLVGV